MPRVGIVALNKWRADIGSCMVPDKKVSHPFRALATGVVELKGKSWRSFAHTGFHWDMGKDSQRRHNGGFEPHYKEFG
jgi:hypothetical protein